MLSGGENFRVVPSPDVSMRSKISLLDYLVGADEAA